MMDPNKDLISKIRVLEEENLALSEKVEYSILLNVIAESIDSSEDINQIIEGVLEKICILKHLPFAGLFSLKDKEHKLINFYQLFGKEIAQKKTFHIPEKIVRETKEEGFLFMEDEECDKYNRVLAGEFPQIKTLLFYHISPKFFPDAILVFADDDEDSQLPSMIYLFEQAITYLVEKLDKLYYWTELQKLNNELEERVARRTSDLVTAKNEAVKADSLKTIFLQNMSHEIRTPLNAIVGFSDLLNSQDLDKSRIEEFTGIISRSSAQLLSLVNDILDISKIESGLYDVKFEPVNLSKLLNSLNMQYGPVARKKGLEFVFELPAGMFSLMVKSDIVKLQQVLVNLIVNAIKFTESGEVKLSCLKKEGELVISVSDSGIGIAEKDHGIIFERFRQVDMSSVRSYGGTGLGLYICKTYMEMLGGGIWMESEVGKGSIFHISLPEAIADKQTIDEKLVMDSGLATATDIGLLVVEDEDTNFMLLEAYLSDKNILVTRARNGLEAVDLLKENHYELVLMDIQMPVMNGLEATRRIREFDRDTPVIAVTAFAFENEKKQALEAGCNAHFSKPVKKEVLLKAIAHYLPATKALKK
jgi:signal transduction histidine kinase/CheY-like chemotaxis protein